MLVNCASCGRKISDRAPACPFCKTMLSDGLADQGHDTVAQLDLAELLWASVQTEVPVTAPA